jgi:hypothetical protein
VVGVNFSKSDGLHTVTVLDPAQQRYELCAHRLIDATRRGPTACSPRCCDFTSRSNEQKNFLVSTDECREEHELAHAPGD